MDASASPAQTPSQLVINHVKGSLRAESTNVSKNVTLVIAHHAKRKSTRNANVARRNENTPVSLSTTLAPRRKGSWKLLRSMKSSRSAASVYATSLRAATSTSAKMCVVMWIQNWEGQVTPTASTDAKLFATSYLVVASIGALISVTLAHASPASGSASNLFTVHVKSQSSTLQ